MLYFSKTTLGFYDTTVHSDIPEDAVEISHKERDDLLKSTIPGMCIGGDKNGRPILIPYEPTDEEQWMMIRRKRDVLLKKADTLVMPDYPLEDDVKSRWRVYRQTLRDIPQTYQNPKDVIWPEIPS